MVRHRESGLVYISKKIRVGGMNAEEVDKVKQEVWLMQKFSHPCIVELVESFLDDEVLVIVMEFCAAGDLETLISFHKKQKAVFPEDSIRDWIAQMSSALGHVHSMKIIHRDIKPSNVFITSDGRLKLGDFGISRQLEHTDDSASTLIGTPLYMSPEVCSNQSYTYKTDMWSLGCVFYELCSFARPFEAESLVGLALQILHSTPPQIPAMYSPELRALISSLIHKEPSLRPSARDVLISLGMCDLYSNAELEKNRSQLYSYSIENFNFDSFNTASKTESYSSDFESFSRNQESARYEDDFESY